MLPMKVNKGYVRAIFSVIRLAVAGLMYGVVVYLFAVFMQGGGHGWSGAGVSIFMIVLGPLHGATWALRGKPIGFAMASILFICAAAMDFDIFRMVRIEGTGDLGVVWKYMPWILLLWIVMWVVWQVAVCWTLYLSFKSFYNRRAH